MLQELMRREVEEHMRNAYADAMLAGLAVKMKTPMPADSRAVVEKVLTHHRRGAKPTGKAAAAAQDAWETL